jgi:hypothetical protein
MLAIFFGHEKKTAFDQIVYAPKLDGGILFNLIVGFLYKKVKEVTIPVTVT